MLMCLVVAGRTGTLCKQVQEVGIATEGRTSPSQGDVCITDKPFNMKTVGASVQVRPF
jgi:hypothetical protein